MRFAYLPHGISIQFPSIPQIFCIFDMHYFKACQTFYSSHLWKWGSWHWNMCSHLMLVVVCHPFPILIELPCCFYFQTVSWCFLNGKNSTSKTQINVTANRADRVNISVWKVPLVYFPIIDGTALWISVILSVSTTEVNFVKSLARTALDCHFSGDRACIHHAQLFVHNTHSNQSVILVYQNNTNSSAPYVTLFKVWFGRESSTMLPRLATTFDTIRVFMIFYYIFRT